MDQAINSTQLKAKQSNFSDGRTASVQGQTVFISWLDPCQLKKFIDSMDGRTYFEVQ